MFFSSWSFSHSMVPSWSITNISSLILVAPCYFSKKRNLKKKQRDCFFVLFLTFLPHLFFFQTEQKKQHREFSWFQDVVKQLTLELLEWKCKSSRAVDKDFVGTFPNDINGLDVVTSCSTNKNPQNGCLEWWNIVPNIAIIMQTCELLWFAEMCSPCSTTGTNIYLPIL